MADDLSKERPRRRGYEDATFAGRKTEEYGIARPRVLAEHETGGNQQPGILDAVRTIKWSDFAELHQKPCVREAFMVGIGSGTGFGGLRAVFGASVLTSCNWAVGTFCLGSILMHEWCQRRRKLSKDGMKRAVEAMERKRTEQKANALDALQKQKPGAK